MWGRVENFKDKVAIVTGGASGIGKALCEELAARDAIVIVSDSDAPGAEEVAAAIRQNGRRAHAQLADVTNEQDISKLVTAAVTEHGTIDYFFNNAGVGIAADARDLNLDQWRHVVDVNLYGTIHGTMAAYQLMTKQGHGHIVNIASLSGLLPSPANVPYATTKFAVVGLSLSLRSEAADLGVKVSVVCPAYVRSQIFQRLPVLNMSREQLLATIPFRFMEADKAARIILDRVLRNKAIIVFPLYARLFWWIYRFNGSLLSPMASKMVRDFRRIRSPKPSNMPDE